MSNLTEIFAKIRRKWTKIRLQPIRVLCFHQVSDEYNPLTMWDCDWTQTERFKCYINKLQKQGYHFISLISAQEKLKHNWFRCRKYVVLTADDGYKSMLNILPWLEEQQIPIALFINTKYLDKQSWSDINEEQARRAKSDVDMLTEVCPDLYMSEQELFSLTSPYIEIGMHGHEHLDARSLTIEDFRSNIERNRELLLQHPRYIPYFAYTWGKRTGVTDIILKDLQLIPVLTGGNANYNNAEYIDREDIDGK